jgi:hypothetical protein
MASWLPHLSSTTTSHTNDTILERTRPGGLPDIRIRTRSVTTVYSVLSHSNIRADSYDYESTVVPYAGLVQTFSKSDESDHNYNMSSHAITKSRSWITVKVELLPVMPTRNLTLRTSFSQYAYFTHVFYSPIDDTWAHTNFTLRLPFFRKKLPNLRTVCTRLRTVGITACCSKC